MDSVPTIAKALAERTSRKPRRAKKANKAPKCRRPRRESPKTITARLYRMWSDVVKHLFDHKCAICGEPDSKEHPLNAHHIMPRQNFSGLRFDLKNGAALCPKCHRFGKYSAHKGGIWFAEWLRSNYPDMHAYCLEHRDDELDCRDRMALYGAERTLHAETSKSPSYGFVLYDITALRKDGEHVHADVYASNPKMAETLFWELWPKSEPLLKGIVSCKVSKGDDNADA